MAGSWQCRRKIVSHKTYRTEFHPPKAHDSVIVTFECGHDKRYKWSQRPKAMKFGYCEVCALDDHGEKDDAQNNS